MTLSQIKAMFQPGDVWIAQRILANGTCMLHPSGPRRVIRNRSSEIIWYRAQSIHPLHTPIPKASEVIEASDGYLAFSYTDFTERIEFRRCNPEDSAKYSALIDSSRSIIEARMDEAETERAQLAAKREAERIAALQDTIRQGKSIEVADLIDLIRHHQIPAPPQTIGALRRKVISVHPEGWRYQARKKPRFSYKTQPTTYYETLRKILTTPEPEEEPLTPEDEAALDHLFNPPQPERPPSIASATEGPGQTEPPTNITPFPQPKTPAVPAGFL